MCVPVSSDLCSMFPNKVSLKEVPCILVPGSPVHRDRILDLNNSSSFTAMKFTGVCSSPSLAFAGSLPLSAASTSPSPFAAHVSPLVSLLALSSSASSPLVPSSSSLSPLVPSSSPSSSLVPPSLPSSPLARSSSALPVRPPVPAPRLRPPVPASVTNSVVRGCTEEPGTRNFLQTHFIWKHRTEIAGDRYTHREWR